jgi:ribosomal protein S27AE
MENNNKDNPMADFINLTCPSCGAKLQITNDIDRFSCSHCGNEQIVKRAGGIITLAPVIEEIKGVRHAADKTSSELAIVRLKKEIDELIKEKYSIGPDGLVVFVLFIIGIVLLGVGISSFSEGEVIVGFVFIGIIILGVFIYVKFTSDANKKKETITLKIQEKLEELEKHKEIVKKSD